MRHREQYSACVSSQHLRGIAPPAFVRTISGMPTQLQECESKTPRRRPGRTCGKLHQMYRLIAGYDPYLTKAKGADRFESGAVGTSGAIENSRSCNVALSYDEKPGNRCRCTTRQPAPKIRGSTCGKLHLRSGRGLCTGVDS